MPLTETGLLAPDCWTWPEFQIQHQTMPWEATDPVMAEPQPEVDVVEPVPPLPSPQEPNAEPETAADEPDSSSSASDISACADDLEGVMADPTAVDELAWFKQGSKTHVASELTAEQQLIPYCRDIPFAQDPVKRGAGFVQGCEDQVCKRCLSRMPRGLYQALAEHNGWSN